MIEEAELKRLRLHIARGQPFGTVQSTAKAANRTGLESSMRDRGRPKKEKESEHAGISG